MAGSVLAISFPQRASLSAFESYELVDLAAAVSFFEAKISSIRTVFGTVPGLSLGQIVTDGSTDCSRPVLSLIWIRLYKILQSALSTSLHTFFALSPDIFWEPWHNNSYPVVGRRWRETASASKWAVQMGKSSKFISSCSPRFGFH